MQNRNNYPNYTQDAFVKFTEHIKNSNQALGSIDETLKKLYNKSEEVRRNEEWIAPISNTMPFIVDYRNRDKVYMYSTTALVLSVEDLGTVSVPVNTWIDISFPAGYRLLATGQTALVYVFIRATDDFMTSPSFNLAQVGGSNISLGQNTMANSIPVAIASNQSAIPVSGSIGSTSDYPAGAIPITATSGNVANAVATATLAASATAKTWITGFEVYGTGATAALVVSVTVTNAAGNTLTYTYVFVAGATTANAPLNVQFTKPIPTSAINTAIAVSCPASGAGGTNNTVNAHGYQL